MRNKNENIAQQLVPPPLISMVISCVLFNFSGVGRRAHPYPPFSCSSHLASEGKSKSSGGPLAAARNAPPSRVPQAPHTPRPFPHPGPRTKIKTLVLCFLCTGSLFLAPKEALVAKDCFFSFLGSPPSASPRAAPPARPSAVAMAVTRAEDCPPLAAGGGGSGYEQVFKSPTTARSGPPCGGWIAPESGVPLSPAGDSPCASGQRANLDTHLGFQKQVSMQSEIDLVFFSVAGCGGGV